MSSIKKPQASPRRRAFYFGAGALLILGGFGALLAFRKHHYQTGGSFAGVGAAVFLLALISPPATLWLRALWLRLAAALGWVNSRILLTVIFFVLLTPIALLRRLLSRGPDASGALDLKWSPGTRRSDWQTHPANDSKHYEHPW